MKTKTSIPFFVELGSLEPKDRFFITDTQYTLIHKTDLICICVQGRLSYWQKLNVSRVMSNAQWKYVFSSARVVVVKL